MSATLFDGRVPEVGPRLMTVARQRLCIGYVQAVVDDIENNTLDAGVLERLRRSGTYILTHPEQTP